MVEQLLLRGRRENALPAALFGSVRRRDRDLYRAYRDGGATRRGVSENFAKKIEIRR